MKWRGKGISNKKVAFKNPFHCRKIPVRQLLLNLVPTVTVVTDVLLDKVRMGALKKEKVCITSKTSE